ncbi:MAG: ABC transporter permease [Chloroflexota bacterium]
MQKLTSQERSRAIEPTKRTDRTSNRRQRFSGMAIILLLSSIIALLVLALPQIVLVIRGVQTHGWEGLPGSSVSVAIVLSLETTAVSTLLTVMFGTPLAFILSRWRFPMRRLLIVLVELPIVLPPTVAGLALLLTAGRRGLLGPLLGSLGIELPFTTAAVVIAQTFISAPFFIRAAMVGFQAVPREIEDAAKVDGATDWQLFWHITLRLSATALAAGLTLSWARALGEFGATILFAGSIAGRTQTMTLLVYSVFESSIDAAIWASLILLGLAFIALVLSQWLSHRTEEND